MARSSLDSNINSELTREEFNINLALSLLNKHRDDEEAAKEMGLSVSRFRDYFIQYYRMTARQYLNGGFPPYNGIQSLRIHRTTKRLSVRIERGARGPVTNINLYGRFFPR